MEKFLKILNSSVSSKLCVGMESARFVASSKGTNLLKDGNNYLYFHYKDKVNNTQATYRCQKYRNGCKAVAVLQKESNLILEIRNDHSHGSDIIGQRVRELETEYKLVS